MEAWCGWAVDRALVARYVGGEREAGESALLGAVEDLLEQVAVAPHVELQRLGTIGVGLAHLLEGGGRQLRRGMAIEVSRAA
jgi:hypothetical protein